MRWLLPTVHCRHRRVFGANGSACFGQLVAREKSAHAAGPSASTVTSRSSRAAMTRGERACPTMTRGCLRHCRHCRHCSRTRVSEGAGCITPGVGILSDQFSIWCLQYFCFCPSDAPSVHPSSHKQSDAWKVCNPSAAVCHVPIRPSISAQYHARAQRHTCQICCLSLNIEVGKGSPCGQSTVNHRTVRAIPLHVPHEARS